MPGLRLYTSNRLETLAEKLAEVLRAPLASPLQGEIIVVQSKGMERWVSMELARLQGICANCSFPFPNHFVHRVFREVFPEVPEDSPFDPAVMTWQLMGLLPAGLDKPGFENLRKYFEEGNPELKRFQLCARIADLFDQYSIYRPEMILKWDNGEEEHWQAVLWRELARGQEQHHRAALRQAFLKVLEKPGLKLANIPERIAVFGISVLPPYHVQILTAVARLVEVNLFLMNPCREYWGEIVSGREMVRVTGREIERGAKAEQLHLEKGNALLASMGALGRDFFEILADSNPEESQSFIDPGEATLLASIQSDILNLREGSGKRQAGGDDDSIQVHICHSPMREVEALQDRLLALFAADPTLLPRDILVMTPDIETYAPFIQAVFSVSPKEPRWIPFSIADRGARRESQLIDAFLALLDLHGSRFAAPQVLAVLESPAVQRRFSLSEADLELIHRWTAETRIRWGIDESSRKELGLPEFSENTWKAGLDRILLGYALPGGNEKMFMGILPFDPIEGGEAELLGHFLTFTETLFASVKELGASRTLAEWGEFLSGIAESFFLADGDTERELMKIRGVLQDLAGKQTRSGFNEKIGLEVVKSHLRLGLEVGFGVGFLTGGLTFCAMLPMRSIPFKVICMIGMNDDAYPRQAKPLGFDLMAKHPRRGDRSRRYDDRYLFLESILSARERLHISYVGQNIQDNSPRPPSVLVSELLDDLAAKFEISAKEPGEKEKEEKEILERFLTRHRLQAFSPDYFRRGGKLASYSPENFAAALGAADRPEQTPAFISRGLSPPPEEWKTVELQRLCRFFANPARFLLTQRLGLYLEEEGALLEEDEPFDLEGLERYQFEQGLVARAFNSGTLEGSLPVFKASGQLPHGTPGECLFGETSRAVETFVRRLLPLKESGALAPVEVDLAIAGFRVTGHIENIYEEGLLQWRYGKMRSRDRLTLWLHHLVLSRVKGQDNPCQGILICKEGECRCRPVPECETLLIGLLQIYWRGLTRPVPFFPESSWEYARAIHKGLDPDKAVAAARKAWEGSDFNRGEAEDPFLRICFGKADPLDREFRELAAEIFGPFLKYEGKE